MGKKKVHHRAKTGNPMLNKIHQKEKRVFDQKLEIALQMGFDAACLASRDVFQLGEGRFIKFANAYKTWLNRISALLAEDSPDLEYSAETLDTALKQIAASNFVPFDERYLS